MQEWTLNLFNNLWNDIGIKKYVQILPKEILEEFTSYQIRELATIKYKMLYLNKFVEDYESALKWIME